MKISTNQLKRLVTEKLKISDILYKYNPEGNYQPGQTCFCPFHDNSNTPAASIYDNEGVETLYCFGECRRLYTSADAIELLLKKDVYEVARHLWDRMSEPDKREWLSKQTDGDYSDVFEFEESKPKDFSKSFQKARLLFKRGKISVRELLKEYLKSYSAD